MGKYYESICAVCPYYVGEASHKIVCDGSAIYEDTNIHLTFALERKKREHKGRFCYAFEFARCPIAAKLTELAQEQKFPSRPGESEIDLGDVVDDDEWGDE